MVSFDTVKPDGSIVNRVGTNTLRFPRSTGCDASCLRRFQSEIDRSHTRNVQVRKRRFPKAADLLAAAKSNTLASSWSVLRTPDAKRSGLPPVSEHAPGATVRQPVGRTWFAQGHRHRQNLSSVERRNICAMYCQIVVIRGVLTSFFRSLLLSETLFDDADLRQEWNGKRVRRSPISQNRLELSPILP